MPSAASASVRPPSRADYRAVRLDRNLVDFDHRPDGRIYARNRQPIAPFPVRLTERLDHWAAQAPDRVFIARRDPAGDWRKVGYGQARDAARAIGEALLQRGLSAERPLVVLSGNDIEHALLGLGALYAGVPYAPISPAYSTLSGDFGKLRHIVNLLTPGLVFASDGATYGRAIAAVVPPEIEILLTEGALPQRPATRFADLLATRPTGRIDAAHAAIGPDHIAKFLFTSGSTGLPKGVINTQRMLCANQQMIQTSMAFLAETPPVILDWLPWNHTFGGNHNVGLVLYNGGSLYIDDGKPTPQGVKETIRNLHDISPTVYFNVPKGYEALVAHFRRDAVLRDRFFSRLQMMFYAGAGLEAPVWDALDDLAVASCGERIVMLTGLGSTETAPFALVCNKEYSQSGNVGLPVPGVELKLVPVEGKLEARVRGPNITPGYWREPELSAQAFDDEGYYRFGDALRFIDPDAPDKGFRFDGRITEDFKLSSGTWVSVGPLRATVMAHLAPYARDVVLAAVNRDELTALIFPDQDSCRRLAPHLPADAALPALLADPAVRREFAFLLERLAADSTGSSTRIVRALLLVDPPSIDKGEITDKGSINQRAVLGHRADLVDELYARPFSDRVIAITPGGA